MGTKNLAVLVIFLFLVLSVNAEERSIRSNTVTIISTTDKTESVGASKTETTGIEHEDIGIIEDEEGYDAEGRIVAVTQPDSKKPEVDDEVLIAFEQGDQNGGGANEIVMDDTKGSESEPRTEKTKLREGDPDRPIIVGNVPNAEKGSGDVIIKGSKIGENAPAKKPKEIVVVGSKVRSSPLIQQALVNNEELSEDPHKEWIEILSTGVQTEEDLEDYITAVAVTDEAVEEVTFNYQKITFDYSHPAKLFGFIDVDYTAETEVDDQGRVKVKFPWWIGFAQSQSEELKKELEQELSSIGEDAQSDVGESIQNTLHKRKQMIQMLSDISKKYRQTAAGIVDTVVE